MEFLRSRKSEKRAYRKAACPKCRFTLGDFDCGLPTARVSWHVVITPVRFFTYDREVAFRRTKRIGLPRKAHGRHFNLRLHLTCRSGSCEPEMFGGVLVLRGFSGRFPNHLEGHSCRSGNRVQRRPTRLVDHRNSLHLQRHRFPVGADAQPPSGTGPTQ
jgi:hypothetical protein